MKENRPTRDAVLRFHSLAIVSLPGAVLFTLAACSGTSTSTVPPSSTTTEAGATEPSDGGGKAREDTPLSAAAAASPNLSKCKIACALPTDGPCKTASETSCIEKCTVLLEGMKPTCVQCVIESSGWTGVQCPAPDQCKCCTCEQWFGPSSSGGIAGSCAKCPTGEVPSCDPSVEKCGGFLLAKTSSGACMDACAE